MPVTLYYIPGLDDDGYTLGPTQNCRLCYSPIGEEVFPGWSEYAYIIGDKDFGGCELSLCHNCYESFLAFARRKRVLPSDVKTIEEGELLLMEFIDWLLTTKSGIRTKIEIRRRRVVNQPPAPPPESLFL